MNKDDFAGFLEQGTQNLGCTVSPGGIERLHHYFGELRRWSARINLIAKETSDEVIVEKHFIDSLALLTMLDASSDILLDVGSGAGFPGLACKAARPELDIDLAEPRLKRVSFLRHVIRTCGLESIEVLPERLEEGVRIGREDEYSCVVSRAVADISLFLSMCGRFCRTGTRVVCMKGPKYVQEIYPLQMRRHILFLTG
jgi:16S rRNA (guanine527-N7)-methyltransferase